MATVRKKARQRISYVLPLANSPGGHRLGVNSLAIDRDRSILYSAGRDGVICMWDIGRSPNQERNTPHGTDATTGVSATNSRSKSTFGRQEQAHTHWVNDIALVQGNSALVSASSDITVKLWRPHAQDKQVPMTIGLHNDYVKCLASPGVHSDWIASGGLDHKIRIWDLNEGVEKVQIETKEEIESDKGSVYALSARPTIMASGGPESTVRVWDPRTGERITKFVGHTDNVRDILINEDGDMIMSASSDQTIKIWSMAAGRCMHTLTMHDDSVWSLFSDHPRLSVFYSADRSGLVAKTDVRNAVSMDRGRSVAVSKEHNGVGKVVAGEGYIWTATASSSINRWRDVDTSADIYLPDSPHQTFSSLTWKARVPPGTVPPGHNKNQAAEQRTIPAKSLLKISNVGRMSVSRFRELEGAAMRSTTSLRKASEIFLEPEDDEPIAPYHALPEETIEGQNGLTKHVMLNDRKRVLTLDTAGEVILWDLVQCIPIKSYGKKHLDEVLPLVNTQETVGSWCSVDTRTGNLAVVLEEKDCFEGEMYGDQITVGDQSYKYPDDTRVNLGKWVLRYLFANLIDEEIGRDQDYRSNLSNRHQPATGMRRANAPQLGQLPNGWNLTVNGGPLTGSRGPLATPGFSIGVATPGFVNSATPSTAGVLPSLTENPELETRRSRTSGDYFTRAPPALTSAPNGLKLADTSNEAELPLSLSEPDKESKSRFSKKFKMGFTKKLMRSGSEAKQSAMDDRSSASENPDEKEGKTLEDNMYGSIQGIRKAYDQQFQTNPGEAIESGMRPSMPPDTPALKLPPNVTIIIQEDKLDSGGVADLYRGTVSSTGHDAPLIEKAAPMWLGDLLLLNKLPLQDPQKQKQPFVLFPYQGLLPNIEGPDGNNRLNAPRMLRARKVCTYITDKLQETDPGGASSFPEDAPRPENYIKLYCEGQVIPLDMTLATLRQYIWKQGRDIEIYYKSNGSYSEFDRRFAIKPQEAGSASGR